MVSMGQCHKEIHISATVIYIYIYTVYTISGQFRVTSPRKAPRKAKALSGSVKQKAVKEQHGEARESES
jgi:hypothetical protein